MEKQRVLNCRDAGFDCDARLVSDNDEDLVRQAADHLRTAHGMEAPPNLADQVRAIAHDEDAPAATT